jgi:hypothetical protein
MSAKNATSRDATIVLPDHTGQAECIQIGRGLIVIELCSKTQ